MTEQKDTQYIFDIDGNVLALDGGNVTMQDTYVLTKSEYERDFR